MFLPKYLYIILQINILNMSEQKEIKKAKTSVSINPELWRQWITYVVNKHGSLRKTSEELEKALIEYMQNHPI